MAIALKSGYPKTGTDNGSSDRATATIPAGTVADGELVVIAHCNDYRAYSNMLTPTLSGFSPTMNAWGGNDGGNLLSHIKVWAYDSPAGASAADRTVTVLEDGTHDGDKGISVWAFSGADVAATALDVLGTNGSPTSATTPHTFSALTAAAIGEYLLAHIRTSNGAGNSGYTWSGGSIVEQYDVANFTRFTGAGELLSSSGSTGTRTATPSGSTPWVGVMLLIKPAAGGSTLNGTVTFGAAPTLTVAGFVNQPATVSFGAAPTLTAAATRVQPAAVSFGAAPTLAAAATRVQPATVSFGAAPTLTLAGTIVRLGTVSFGAAPTLTAAATLVQPAAVSFGAAPTLTAAVFVQRFAIVTFGAAPTLLATGQGPSVVYATAVLTPGALAAANLTPGATAAVLTPAGISPATLTAGNL